MENILLKQMPSPPLSPSSPLTLGLKIEKYIQPIDNSKSMESALISPIETSFSFSNDDILRNQFINLMEEGVQINGEFIPYIYVIEKLHSIGQKVINKKTKDAIPLRVYEIDKDIYEEFWVHPMFLSLQSFQFFKLFEEVKNNNEQGFIEIEVPSLKAFPPILYWLYTGDLDKLLQYAQINEAYSMGIMENIKYLDISLK